MDEMTQALAVLVDIATDATAAAAARVSAAKAILDTATKLYDVANLAERVRVLEQRVSTVLEPGGWI